MATAYYTDIAYLVLYFNNVTIFQYFFYKINTVYSPVICLT